MRVLLIDNYGSFTCNLLRRNAGVSSGELLELHSNRIVVSPGPRTLKKDWITFRVVRKALKYGRESSKSPLKL